MKIFLAISILLPVILLFQNCSSSKEFGGTEASLLEEGFGDDLKVASFETSNQRLAAVDLVWVFDNSSSMKSEAALVRRNLQKFIETVKSRTDLKMALLSQVGERETSITLPSGLDSQQFVQINEVVRTNNTFNKTIDVLQGSSANFFRPRSQKAFVFVSDDNPKDGGGNDNANAEDFENAFKRVFPNQTFVSHSFISLGNDLTPDCRGQIGAEYKSLAERTDGQIFDICDTNWDDHFDLLAEQIVLQAQSVFDLGEGVNNSSIVEVLINGEKVNGQDYAVNGGLLTISKGLLEGDGTFSIEVKYQ